MSGKSLFTSLKNSHFFPGNPYGRDGHGLEVSRSRKIAEKPFVAQAIHSPNKQKIFPKGFLRSFGAHSVLPEEFLRKK